MCVLLIMLMIYFGIVVLWAGSRLYRMTQTQ